MKGRIFYSCLLIWLCILGLITASFAQTITTGTVTPTSVCSGGTVTVTFVTSGTFAASNTFTAQLSDPTGAFPANPTAIGTVKNAGTLTATIPANTAGGSSYRIRVVSSAPARVGTNSLVALTVNAPPNPTVTVPNPYCEGDPATALSATPSTGGTLNWYGTNATGGTRSGNAPTPNTSVIGTTPYYVSQTIGGCEGPRTSVPVTVKDKPNAPGASPIGYCVGQAASPLTATAVAGATLNWYTVPSNGTALSGAPTPSTTGAGSTTYYVSQTLNGCEGPRASIVVTVSAPPAAPTAPAPTTYCQGAQAIALSASGQGLKWYGTAATGGTASPTPTTPATTTDGTTNYYVSQTVNGCESARTAIAVVVKPQPASPTIPTTAPSYCQSQTAVALSATPSTGGTLNWYGTNATGGTPSPTANTPVTTQAGTVNYYVSQTVNSCESNRASIPVTIKSTPSAPTVASPVTACQSQTAVALTAAPSTGGTLNWYGTAPTGGTPSSAAPAPSTTALGSTTYYVSQSVAGCEGPRASLTVTVSPVPAPPTATAPAPFCQGATVQSLTATGQGLKWYGTAATGGTGSSNPTIPSTTTVGPATYYVTQTVNGCESGRTPIAVSIKPTPSAPATSAIEFCQGTPAPVLSATFVTNATPKWYGTAATGGTGATIPPALSNNTPGTTTYYVSQTLESCESPRASVNVRVKALPAAPGVNSISYCNNQVAQPLQAQGAELKWFDLTGNPLGGVPTPNTSIVGDQTFGVSQTVDNCEGPKATLTVTIKPLPGAPGVSPVSYCQKQQDQPAQNIDPLKANGSDLRWYTTDNNSIPNAPIPSIDQAGVQTYQVSQVVNGCEGAKATLQVTVNAVAAPVVPKPLVAYCINDNATPLEAVAASGASLRWIDPYNRPTNDAPTPSTLNTNVDPQGDAFYVYQIGANGCYSARSMIRVVVNTTPTLALVAPVASVNLGQTAPLHLRFTGSGPYSYTLTGGYAGTSRTSDTTIAVLPRGNTTYQVTAVQNGCGIGLPGNPATAMVTVRVPTVSTELISSSTLCAGTSLVVPFTTTGEFNQGNQFQIELASAADTSKKYDVLATANSSPVTGDLPSALPSGQYFVRVKASNPGIGVTGSNSPTMLTVRSLPSATLAGTQNIYEGTPANLTITLGGDGPWTIAYADSIRSYSAIATTNPYVSEVRPARTTNYRITSVSNSCGTGPSSGTATVAVLPLLGVEDNSLDPLVKTYPVPTTTTITVELDLPLTRDPATLTVIDFRGRTILQQLTRNRRNELDLTSQPNGLYMLRIQVGDRQTARKILKQ
ncbi:T9SS type A sorting domain-containing protein [Spirosoma soli]|uniref:T9SS type A sorting domain-containing protein n=1 Tax=Spirosoma soli TaxID=1770529 RepID=A0ABW5M7I7_9BACT